MLQNYFLSALRSLARHKSSVAINLLGLVLGFTCFLVINLYVYREFHYDAHHEKASRIYRITHNEKAGEIPGTRHLATVGPPVGPALKEAFPQIEDAVRFRYSSNRIVRYREKQHYENRVYYADSSIFKIFTLPLSRVMPLRLCNYPMRSFLPKEWRKNILATKSRWERHSRSIMKQN